MSKASREKILAIIDELEYQPNILARTLATKKTFSFSLLVPEANSPEAYWNKPMTGVRKAFQEIQQYGVEISTHLFRQSDSQTFVREAALVLESQPDGVVLAPFFSRESKIFIADLQLLKIPYVFIDSNFDDSNKLSYIGQDSFQSGTLAARLLDYALPEKASLLILHFAKEMDNQNHLVQREKGFYDYFRTKDTEVNKKLITLEIAHPTDLTFSEKLEAAIDTSVKGIFVTNSQVYHLCKFLTNTNRTGIRVIGHDLISENIDCLKNGTVDFLICQRPEEQGYNAVITLFDHIIMNKSVIRDNYTSIDIITKENLEYYK